MASDEVEMQVNLVEELKKMAGELENMESMSKSLASKSERVSRNNSGECDKIMAYLKQVMDEIDGNCNRETNKAGDHNSMNDVIINEIERQLVIETDVSNSYQELERKTRNLKKTARSILGQLCPDGEVGDFPLMQTLTNYHAAVSAAHKNFVDVPNSTARLLEELKDIPKPSSQTPEQLSNTLAKLTEKLRRHHETLRRNRGPQNKRDTFSSSSASREDLEAAGWRCS